MQPQKAKTSESEGKVKKEEVAVNGEEVEFSFRTKLMCCLFVEEESLICHSSLGDVQSEGKSLMEQLRGEALKFHKTG